jgi:Polyketide cyclase / dehydrase and lipid transport
MAKSYYSTIFEHSADDVWNVIRDFNNYPVWVNGAGKSEIELGKSGDSFGAVRIRRVRQRLLAMSDVERSQTYEFAGTASVPVENYRATLRVTQVVDGNRASSSGGQRLIADLNAARNKLFSFALRSGNGSSHCGVNWLAQALLRLRPPSLSPGA